RRGQCTALLRRQSRAGTIDAEGPMTESLHLARMGAFVLVSVLPLAARAQVPPWKPVEGHIMTRWAEDGSPEKGWPVHPPPRMVREKWMSLNGLWDYEVVDIGAYHGPDIQPAIRAGKILVPFPFESALSGVGGKLEPTQSVHYRRQFSVPDSWKDQ